MGALWLNNYPVWLCHRIGRHTEVPLALEALKFVSSRISHYACCPPLLWPVIDIFWPINTLYWLAAPPSGQSTAYFCIKTRGHVAPLSATSVYLPILWLCLHAQQPVMLWSESHADSHARRVSTTLQ